MIRVWVTRDEPNDGPLGEALRAAGLEPVHEPVITRSKRSDARDELALLGADDWIVLTSAFAVECLAVDAISAASPPHVVAMGEATADAARERGLHVDDIADRISAARLFEHLRHRMTCGIVCYPRSSLASPPAPWMDVTVLSPVVYETKQRYYNRSIVDRVDVAAAASPSAVHAIGRVDLPLVSIGPTTTAAIRDLGMEPAAEAVEPSFASLARAIASLFGQKRP